MSEIKEIIMVTNTGYRLVRRVHHYYSAISNHVILRPLYFLIFIFLFPFLSAVLLLLNGKLHRFIKEPLVINAGNYSLLKSQFERLTVYVNYFHTFFNADAKMLSWIVRPLFPLIKKHIRLQADYRVVLHNKILALNAKHSGTHFVFLNETELWDYRNKAYDYLA